MDHRLVIEAILGVYASLLKDKIPPKNMEELKEGVKFNWILDSQTELQVEQFNHPANTFYHLKHKLFELTLFEDEEHHKYKLDAPRIQDDGVMAEWLYSHWNRYHQNLQYAEAEPNKKQKKSPPKKKK